MIKKLVINKLIDWKNSKEKLPVILRGARQVGKTTLIQEFSLDFENYIEFNLERKEDQDLFALSSVTEIFEAAILQKKIKLKEGKTLVFIDEIQEVPSAIGLLRYFHEDLPEIYVIAAGSLLEFALDKVSSFPVGRVDFLYIHPVTFEEFLITSNTEKMVEVFHTVPLPDFAHDILLTEFNTYAILGGMPQILQQYLNKTPISNLKKYYNRLWQSYVNDIEKYAKNMSEKNVLRFLMQAAPYEKDRISFERFGNSNYRSREIGDAMRALDLAGIIRLIYPSTSLAPPIVADYKKRPRLQFLDTGLLAQVLSLQGRMIGLSDLCDFERGKIIQHLVTQELIAVHDEFNYKPNFWVRENKDSNSEVDLLYHFEDKIIPIEIKSGKQGTLRSLHQFVERSNHPYAIRMYAGKFSIENHITPGGKPYKLMNLPYFLVSKIEAYLHLLCQE
jgi:predicted AAA+ superfamily ATPase